VVSVRSVGFDDVCLSQFNLFKIEKQLRFNFYWDWRTDQPKESTSKILHDSIIRDTILINQSENNNSQSPDGIPEKTTLLLLPGGISKSYRTTVYLVQVVYYSTTSTTTTSSISYW